MLCLFFNVKIFMFLKSIFFVPKNPCNATYGKNIAAHFNLPLDEETDVKQSYFPLLSLQMIVIINGHLIHFNFCSPFVLHVLLVCFQFASSLFSRLKHIIRTLESSIKFVNG